MAVELVKFRVLGPLVSRGNHSVLKGVKTSGLEVFLQLSSEIHTVSFCSLCFHKTGKQLVLQTAHCSRNQREKITSFTVQFKIRELKFKSDYQANLFLQKLREKTIVSVQLASTC